jgi:hypothetical protein
LFGLRTIGVHMTGKPCCIDEADRQHMKVKGKI